MPSRAQDIAALLELWAASVERSARILFLCVALITLSLGGAVVYLHSYPPVFQSQAAALPHDEAAPADEDRLKKPDFDRFVENFNAKWDKMAQQQATIEGQVKALDKLPHVVYDGVRTEREPKRPRTPAKTETETEPRAKAPTEDTMKTLFTAAILAVATLTAAPATAQANASATARTALPTTDQLVVSDDARYQWLVKNCPKFSSVFKPSSANQDAAYYAAMSTDRFEKVADNCWANEHAAASNGQDDNGVDPRAAGQHAGGAGALSPYGPGRHAGPYVASNAHTGAGGGRSACPPGTRSVGSLGCAGQTVTDPALLRGFNQATGPVCNQGAKRVVWSSGTDSRGNAVRWRLEQHAECNSARRR